MKTLTTPVSNSAAATQSGWVELYDFYLNASIATPWGTTNIIRLCTLPGGFAFFAPQQAPEPAGTQASAQTYQYWPLMRGVAKGDTKFQDDKLQITASNVTSQFAGLLALINWYDTPVVIRKVPLFQTGLTAADCAVVFSGLVDSVVVTAQQLQFMCSGSLSMLSYLLPSENMHAACRFRFGDDLCTVINYLPENYLAGTVGSGSSTVNVKSSNLTQDTGSSAGYGTDLVNALADSAITASSSQPSFANEEVTVDPDTDTVVLPKNLPFRNRSTMQFIFAATVMPFGLTAGTHYYAVNVTGKVIQVSLTSGGAPVNITSTGSGVTLTQYIANVGGYTNQPVAVSSSTDEVTLPSHGLTNGTIIVFGGTTVPAPAVAGQAYFIVDVATSTFKVSTTLGGAAVNFTDAGFGVTITTIQSISASGVKSSNGTGWAFGLDSDWGTQVQGYYQIPAIQAGLTNGALTPWIQFDFTSPVTPAIWQVSSFDSVQAEERVRLIEFFSSPDATNWTFESYFEMPNITGITGVLFDVLIAKASTARYWRICVRSRWAEALYYLMFAQVSAYAGSRNWWLAGQITFDGNVTPALAGVTRQVSSSFNGELFCAALPVAPASGDTYTLKRGCPRTFNACCARLNTENYGGFNDLELQNLVNFVNFPA